MELLNLDRMRSQVRGYGPLPTVVREFLDGSDVSELEIIHALRDVFGMKDSVGLGDTPWWQHAVAVARGAALVSRVREGADERAAFVAGLLHDVGHLIMLHVDPDGLHRVLTRQQQGDPFLAIERDLYGVDHVHISEQLALRWELGDDVVDAIRLHHDPAASMAPTVAAVVLADAWAQLLGHGYDFPVGGLSLRADDAASCLDLLWSEQLELIRRMDGEFRELCRSFGVTDDPLSGGPGGRKAIWVSMHGGAPTPLGKLLLQQRGYDLIHVGISEPLEACDHGLVLVDSPWAEPGDLLELLKDLKPGANAPVAVMSDMRTGRTLRHRDPVTGICGIPRSFSAFDIRWLENHLATLG